MELPRTLDLQLLVRIVEACREYRVCECRQYRLVLWIPAPVSSIIKPTSELRANLGSVAEVSSMYHESVIHVWSSIER